MKLSPKQKEVIRKMREGAIIRNYYGGRNDSFRINGGSITVTTFEILRDLKLVERQAKEGRRMSGSTYYQLTELGKNLNLDL